MSNIFNFSIIFLNNQLDSLLSFLYILAIGQKTLSCVHSFCFVVSIYFVPLIHQISEEVELLV